MKKIPLVCLAALTALVSGCPHNEYTVILTPRGNVVGRELIFYRADGVNSNGVPNYQEFPSNELATISALYPPDSVTCDGQRRMAKGEFSGAMPGDIGGAGSYKNFSTSLGSAGFYVERFRGNDDLSAQMKQRLAAADQLADYVVGWSRVQFGRESNYKTLRKFLDVDFRNDLKNAAIYEWAGGISASFEKNAGEEFVVRFGEYLTEHGYATLEDQPKLAAAMLGQDNLLALHLAQKVVEEKLGVSSSNEKPESLAVFDDWTVLEKSWDQFLARMPAYRAKLRQWEKEKKSKPDLQKPEPTVLADDLIGTVIDPSSPGDGDHLTVKLSLSAAPVHSNGKWDETKNEMIWESGLEERDKATRLPVFCYASWCEPNKNFQEEHFGRAILDGDDLLKYCVWRDSLEDPQALAWDAFLASLQRGEALTNKLEAFRFSSGKNIDAANYAKELIKTAAQQKR